MKRNEKGFSVVEVLVVIIIVGLIAAIGWFVVGKQKDKATNSDATKNTTQQTADKDTTQETTKANPNEGFLVVKEWGLRFKTPTGLADVKYAIHDDTLAFFAKPSDSSVQYVSNYDKFEDSNFTHAIGVLYRSTSSTKPFSSDGTRQGEKVGNYYYYTNWAFSGLATGAGCVGLYGSDDSSCQQERKAFQLVNQGDSGLLNTIELAQ
jgi:prepilin-type N-terminal cleavage/methylation domain-containing protein